MNLRANVVSRWIGTDTDLDRGTYFWPYVGQMGHRVLVESRNHEVLGLVAQALAQRGLGIEWGGQWLGEDGDQWENWLVVSKKA